MKNNLLTHSQTLPTPLNRPVGSQPGSQADTHLDELFGQLVKQTPCPVRVETSYRDIGRYYSTNQYTSRPIPYIEIESTGNNLENVISLLHEKAHAAHEKNNCKCMNVDNHTLAEYHAFRDSLKTALKLNDKEIVKLIIRDIKKAARDVDQNAHRSAARRIVKLKLWQKALDFVKDENETPHVAPV